MEPSEREGTVAFVRASHDMLLMVDEGDVVAASRTAATLLGARTGALLELLATIAPSLGPAKLKAAQTRLRRKPSTRMSAAGHGGEIGLRLFRLSDTAMLVQLDLPQPVCPAGVEAMAGEAPVTDASRRVDPAYEAVAAGRMLGTGDGEARSVAWPIAGDAEPVADDIALPAAWDAPSHPDLSESYARHAFLTQIAASLRTSRLGENALALVAVSIEDAAGVQPYWLERDAVRAVLARLNEVVRGHDVIAHLGGPRFGVVQGFARSEGELTMLCRRVIETLMDPFDEPSMPTCVELSIARLYRAPGDRSAVDLAQALEQAGMDGVRLCALGGRRAGGRSRIVSLSELSGT